ncbi:MAG: DUF2786 domain-containing protein [Acidimicrobiales bacterium]
MGINNRQRRKAKKLQREKRADRSHAQGHHGARQHRYDRPLTEVELVRQGVLLAAHAFRFYSEHEFAQAFEDLGWLRERVGFGAVDEAVTYWVELALDGHWNQGWQPGDVVRVLGRKLGSEPVAAVVDLIAASAVRRPEATRDRRWEAQIDVLRAESGPSATGSATAWEKRLHAAVRALSLLLHLPPLPKLARSSGAARGGTRHAAGADAVLERVRALLAKAESTPFPEEADAFTAKAQELMARHAIDQAMLDAGGRGDSGGEIIGWRIGVDDPYAAPKSLLLHAIAQANRSHSVYSSDLGFATVFGTEADLEVVELLFTSLLVQGTEAMVRAGRSIDGSGRSRTRSFRQAFLVAFAVRIGERLDAVTREVVAEGERRYGDALLPVLASREQAVQDAVNRVFPELVQKGLSVANRAGYAAGRAAAETASLTLFDELPERAVRYG